MQSDSLTHYKEEIISIKDEYLELEKTSSASEAMLQAQIDTIKNDLVETFSSRALKLLSKHFNRTNEELAKYFDEKLRAQRFSSDAWKLEIFPDLKHIFPSGYSMNYDKELLQDFTVNTDKIEWYVIPHNKEKLRKMFEEQILTVNINFKTPIIDKEFITSANIQRISTLSSWLVNIKNIKYYKESEYIPDQLAYKYYDENNIDAEKCYFLRQGDHIYKEWISGLAEVITNLLLIYIKRWKTIHWVEYKRHVLSVYNNNILNAKEIEKFNETFKWLFSASVSEGGKQIIYKMLIV